MMATFNHILSYGSTVVTEYRTLTNSFGDGYQQDVEDGINNVKRVWQVQIKGCDQALGDEIESFLNAHRGGQSFDWTPPRGAAGKWKCRKGFTRVPVNGPHDDITCEFEEVFGA